MAQAPPAQEAPSRPEPITLDDDAEHSEHEAPQDKDAEGSLLETVAKEHNFPTARRMGQILAQRGVRILPEKVRAFVREQAFRRALRPDHIPSVEGRELRRKEHPVKAGVYNLGRPRSRMFADLVQFSASKASKGFTHFLLVSDAFSRKLYGELVHNTTGLEVSRALREVLHEIGQKPQELVTDNGPEFKNADVRALMEREGVFQTFKEVGDFNVLAQLDVAIKSLKRAIALQKGNDPRYEWADHLQELLGGENKVPRDHLLGGNAEGLDKFGSDKATFEEANIGFDLQRMAADKLQLNERNIDQREARLRQSGEFDAPITPKRSRFKRGEDVRWKTGLRVQHVEGNRVVDTEGHVRQVRRVVIAHGNTERAQAERYRELIFNWLESRPDRTARASDLASFLRQHDLGRRPSIERLAQLLTFGYYKKGPVSMVRL